MYVEVAAPSALLAATETVNVASMAGRVTGRGGLKSRGLGSN